MKKLIDHLNEVSRQRGFKDFFSATDQSPIITVASIVQQAESNFIDSLNVVTEEVPVMIISGIINELNLAEFKHEWDPGMTLFEKVSILTEESGEVAKSANDKDISGLKIELMQTAAVCIRILKTLK